jgi:hypothetical protein
MAIADIENVQAETETSNGSHAWISRPKFNPDFLTFQVQVRRVINPGRYESKEFQALTATARDPNYKASEHLDLLLAMVEQRVDEACERASRRLEAARNHTNHKED